MSQCLNPVVEPNSSVGQMGAELLAKMGISTCTTSSQAASAAGKISAGLFSGGAGASFAAAEQSSESSGCDDLNALINNYQQNIVQAKCYLTNNKDAITQNISNNNSVTMNAGGSVMPNPYCQGQSSITQVIGGKVALINSMSTQSVSQIADSVKNSVNNWANTLQQKKTSYGSTPNGIKDLQAVQQSLNSSDILSQINNNYKSLNVSVQNSNSIVLNAGGNIYPPCNITQDSILDMQISSMLAATYANAVGSAVSNYVKNASKYKSDSTATGYKPVKAPSLPFSSFKDVIIMGVIAIAVIIGLVIIFKIFSGGQKQKGGMPGEEGMGKGEGGLEEEVAANPEMLALAFPKKKTFLF